MISFFFSIVCILSVVVSILLSVYFFSNLARLVRIQVYPVFILYLILIGLIFFQFMPSVLRIFSGWKFDLEVMVSPAEITAVYVLESFSFILWITTIYVVVALVQKNTRVFTISNTLRYSFYKTRAYGTQFRHLLKKESKSDLTVRLFIIVFLIGGVYVNFYSIYNPDSRIAFSFLLAPMLKRSGFALAISCMIFGKLYFGRWLFPIVLTLSTLIILPSLVTGSHGGIVSIAAYIFFANVVIIRSKFLFVLIFLGLLIVAVFSDELHTARAIAQVNKKTTIEEKVGIFLNVSSQESDRSFIEKLEWRFGENSRQSVGFLRMYFEGKHAGLNTIVNSFYSLFPRSLFPNKPYSGSVDGTMYGMGMYLIHGVIEGKPKNMSGFFTGLHAYWEYGLIFVIFTAIVGGVYTAIIILLSDKFGILGLSLLLTYIDTWWQMPKLWLSEIVLQSITYIALYIICLSFIRLFSKSAS